MGYYTKYDLEVDHEVPGLYEAMEQEDASSYGSITDMDQWDSCKWYEHEEDMLAFSIRFPEVLFKLTGEGEEPGDLWIKYFRNGKVQRCQAEIVYPPFDPTKLE